MGYAGITKAYIVLRKEKWDIPAYFTDGSMVGINLAYLTVGRSYGVPFTLDYAYPFIRHARVAFGFPDILFKSEDAFVKLLTRHSETQPDIILGLLPAAEPSTFDRVDFDEKGIVQEFHAGPYSGPLRYSWAIAVWSPNFTEFLHRYTHERAATAAQAPELSAGHAIKAALQEKLRVEGMIVGDESYLDIGTPADLVKAIRDLTDR
jgi:glucose-1-phosphate thymidylyltransferase